tara:strand:- start:4524 stop:5450 length:927 start_codon:yes stop_codon:yes gene_type:complete
LIRTIRPTDVLRLIFDGRNLGPDCSHTWDKLGVYQNTVFGPTQNVGSIILQGQKEPCTVIVNGIHLGGLASVRLRSGPTTWEVHFLNLPDDSIEDSVSLLEFVCKLAGDRGAHKIFLRVPVEDSVISMAKQSGFEVLFKEILYKKLGNDRAQNETKYIFEEASVTSDSMLYRIYSECISPSVKSDYGLTFDEWKDSLEPAYGDVEEAVYVSEGKIHGWIRVITGKTGSNRMEILIHPTEELFVWEEAINWGLEKGIRSNPCLILVPEYQTSLKLALEKSGFIPNETYQLMAASLAVRIENSELIPAKA